LEVHGTLASKAIERAVGGMRQRPMIDTDLNLRGDAAHVLLIAADRCIGRNPGATGFDAND